MGRFLIEPTAPLDYPLLMGRAVLSMFFLLTLSAAAAGVYKSVGPDGRVQYSDRPISGAEQVPLSPASPPPPESSDPGDPAAGPRGDPGPYQAFEIALPEPNATVRSDTGDVQVSLILDPALLPNHRIRILIDNQAVPGQAPGTQVLLKDVTLGTHSLQAQVLDESESPVASTNSVTFHLRRPLPDSALP